MRTRPSVFYSDAHNTSQLDCVRSILERGGETRFGLLPIDDIPDGFEIFRLDVLVLKIESVLPDVNADDRNVREEGVLISGRDDLQLASRLVEAHPAPSATLNSGGLGVHGLLELLYRAEVADNGILKVALLKGTSASGRRGQILPEKRVIDMTAAVELQSCLQVNLDGHGVCFSVFLLGVVQTSNVGLVMLGMMQLHYLLRDMGLESIIGVREVR